ncbi:MAG: restriction endonuclease subunit S, partial [Ignavibacteriae bacterium]|nr:restriction endonuclease subunit S [Ignavibacteriota bacterium]
QEILENKDIILNSERYIKALKLQTVFEIVKVAPFIDFIRGVTYSKDDEVSKNGIKILRANNITIDNCLDLSDIREIGINSKVKPSQKLYKNDILICTASGSDDHVGKVAFIENNMDCYFGGFMAVIRTNEKLLAKYLYELLKTNNFRVHLKNQISSTSIRNLKYDIFESFEIPLPPLDVQQQIVNEIESYQKIIDGAKQIVNSYTPTFVINPNWEMVELGEVSSLMTGGTPTSTVKDYYEGGNINWIVSGDVHKGEIFECENKITEAGMKNSNAKYLPVNSVLIALNGQGKTRGTVAILKCIATCNQSIVSILPNDTKQLIPEFLYYQMKGLYQVIRNITGDKERSGLNMPIIRSIKLYLPPIDEQKSIVKAIDEELHIVEQNKKLIKLFETKIKNKIARVWGE